MLRHKCDPSIPEAKPIPHKEPVNFHFYGFYGLNTYKIKKEITKKMLSLIFSGERGIRTPGPVTVNSFQDCRNRPLCHFSSMLLQLVPHCGCKYSKVFCFCKHIEG